MKEITFRNILDVDNKLQSDIRNWRNTPEISKYMYGNHVITSCEHQKWIESLKYRDDIIFFVIFKDENPIGALYFNNINQEHNIADWGFYLYPPELAGKGYGAIIEYNAINYAFENLRLRKLNCEVLDFNTSVIKMHKKFGFIEEGIRRKHIIKNEKLVDVILLGLLDVEWKICRVKIEKILSKKL